MNKTSVTALAFADIEGKYFAADLDGSDLIGLVKAHPFLFSVILGVIIVVGVLYGANYLIKKRKHEKPLV